MLFHIRLTDDPAAPEKRAQSREAHWDYFFAHDDHFIARGATTSDDQKQFLSSVIWVDFEDWDAVRGIVDNEPNNMNGVYGEVIIRRWRNGLGRRQRDFSKQDGQVYWYVRGHGRPGSSDHREEIVAAQREFLKPYDETIIIARGPIVDDAGEKWQGSANLVCMSSREELDAFLAEWPYCQAGLYERVQIERYRFGGRPGQNV
jgi:uncharacterized protein YciI